MKQVLLLCAVAAAITACATPGAHTSSGETVGAREYPTGSSIPRKRSADSTDGVSTHDREALERARSQVPQAPRPGLGGTP